MTTSARFDHEDLLVRTGTRSGLPIIVAVHSTARGRAVGGCRMWSYPRWRDAVDDAQRLAEAMTWKCAVAELPFGGGKSVIALRPGQTLSGEQRRAAMLDLGDAVESLGGRYGVGEDVGTTADDMWVARQRTEWAYCLPPERGGSGEPAEPTAVGVLAAIAATCRRTFGSADVAGRRFVVIGLGQVGLRVARLLATRRAQLVVTDIDDTKRVVAESLGATWVHPAEALAVETDVLVPAALGGLLTSESVPGLSASAVVGPANNQLGDDRAAALLEERGIRWAPDFVVNAGGVIHGCLVDICGWTHADAMAEVERIGPRVDDIFAEAEAEGIDPNVAALRVAQRKVAEGATAHAPGRASTDERAQTKGDGWTTPQPTR